MELQDFLDQIPDWVVELAINIGKALLILLVGFWITKRLSKILSKSIQAVGISPEIGHFLMSSLDVSLRLVVILVAGSFVGLKLSAIVGMLAAAGFAVGLALQGFLGNFASGITIVVFKPYRVGDWVEISEKFGKVQSVQIFNTIIITPGQKTLVIPNGQVTDNIITNFSTQGHIKLELEVPIPYKEDFPKVKKIILDAIKSCKHVIQDMETDIGILTFDSHSILLKVKPCIYPDDFWKASFEAMEAIKKAFHDNGIPVAYSEGIELGPIGE
ncbi:MAG: mechanosensitive ion channel [Bacteroidia bacterium]|nr:mechanosensitive ion channel [Bacteroidia bacterium]